MALYTYGSTGDEVRKLQSELKKQGYDVGDIDGIYGSKTQNAIRKYQADNKLLVDGIAGDETLGRLYTPIAAPSPAPSTNTPIDVGDISAKPSTNVAPKTQPTTQPITQPRDYFSTSVEKYVSPYSKDIESFLNEIKSYKPFDPTTYNIEKDKSFTTFRDRAMDLGDKAYDSAVAGASRPGFHDSSIGRQVAESARAQYMDRIQDAIPQFMDKARQEYYQQLTDKYNALDALSKLDNVNYGREMADKEFDYRGLRDYITDTGYIPVDTSKISANDPLRQYDKMEGGYQAEINRRMAANPDDTTIPVLEALRYEKVMNDPALLEQYGSTIKTPMGIQTSVKQMGDLTRRGAEIDLKYADAMNQAKLSEINKRISEIGKVSPLDQLKIEQLQKELRSDALARAYTSLANAGINALEFVEANKAELEKELGKEEYARLVEAAEQIRAKAEEELYGTETKKSPWWQFWK